MGDIKAITTYYDGYPFRSRLEARWAVFFNEMGIEYEYEPEGFILSDGTYYLPDFYLPGFHVFFEVKAKHLLGTKEGDEAIRKISDGMMTDSWAGLIAFGDPMDDEICLFCQETDDDGGGCLCDGWCHFWTDKTNNVWLVFTEASKDCSFFTTFESLDRIPAFTTPLKMQPHGNEKVKAAAEKARQARFEHGETPKGRTTK